MRELSSQTTLPTPQGKRKYRVRARPPRTKIDAQVPVTLAQALDAWCARVTPSGNRQRTTRSEGIRQALEAFLLRAEGVEQGAEARGQQKAA